MLEENEYHVMRKTVEKMLTVVEVEAQKLEQLLNARHDITLTDLQQMVNNVHAYVEQEILN